MQSVDLLDLKSNFIEKISSNAFISLRLMKVLVLQDNRLATLHRDVFQKNTLLESLDLSRNKLKKLDKGLFRNQRALQKIDLSFNNWEFILNLKIQGKNNINKNEGKGGKEGKNSEQ
mmetsp:Transcript_47938/g.104511  ORF Transcript_47938/g.104511 Transcript_47938/m.104511 type:complete len:117 (-) Transcript_47938:60-410(-)|eukprot:CAMPEP_0116895298 /NCGR_PEP_ID=MMETSP0467-20121206/4852_1 /TAXON_ID=283647 /ORGANISM="Mesodinium pulex, Strain SPMC105" /LENGTH=116 /DNA_ID=CAMNT_0004565949 /DNA_START=1057 /DNA_END=1407 /DNA_ORIENTATION=+